LEALTEVQTISDSRKALAARRRNPRSGSLHADRKAGTLS
jgi:hypothetical protein